MQSFLNLRNPVCAVHFAGFESNTLTLQQAGWQFAAEQDFHRDGIRLAMKHEGARLHAMTHSITMGMMHRFNVLKGMEHTLPLEFHVAWVSSGARFQIYPITGPMAFRAIDTVPMMEQSQEVSFEDAIPFKPLNHDAPEIVLAKESVPQLMELILKLQDPKQKEIRDKLRRESWRQSPTAGYSPQSDILAQVISIAR